MNGKIPSRGRAETNNYKNKFTIIHKMVEISEGYIFR